jgi:hypothetical protein
MGIELPEYQLLHDLEAELDPYNVGDPHDWDLSKNDVMPATGTPITQGNDICFMNPWTQRYKSLSIDAKSDAPSKEPDQPKKKQAHSRCSERRRAQNRTAYVPAIACCAD